MGLREEGGRGGGGGGAWRALFALFGEGARLNLSKPSLKYFGYWKIFQLYVWKIIHIYNICELKLHNTYLIKKEFPKLCALSTSCNFESSCFTRLIYLPYLRSLFTRHCACQCYGIIFILVLISFFRLL